MREGKKQGAEGGGGGSESERVGGLPPHDRRSAQAASMRHVRSLSSPLSCLALLPSSPPSPLPLPRLVLRRTRALSVRPSRGSGLGWRAGFGIWIVEISRGRPVRVSRGTKMQSARFKALADRCAPPRACEVAAGPRPRGWRWQCRAMATASRPRRGRDSGAVGRHSQCTSGWAIMRTHSERSDAIATRREWSGVWLDAVLRRAGASRRLAAPPPARPPQSPTPPAPGRGWGGPRAHRRSVPVGSSKCTRKHLDSSHRVEAKK